MFLNQRITRLCSNYRFIPKWQMLVLTVVTITFFCYLGHWQLARAHLKENLLNAYRLKAQLAPVLWHENKEKPKQYQRIVVSGCYLPEIFLLDNQHYQHQLGYHVLAPLMLASQKIILIDLGWVKAPLLRQNLPDITSVVSKARVTLSGQAFYPSSGHWSFGQLIERKVKNLTVIELINIQLISQLLHKSVYPFIMRLDANEKGNYIRQWDIIAMSPARHRAYAFQWFAMALTIAIMFVGLNLTKKDAYRET